MSISSLNPYLLFNGDARQAIAHYESAFGVKVTDVQTLGKIPNFPCPPEHAERIIHARLKLGPAQLMFGDVQVGLEAPKHGAQHVSVTFDDPQDMQKKFDALAVGGEVEMPIQDMFWGAKFGALKDRFGISWMLNGPQKA